MFKKLTFLFIILFFFSQKTYAISAKSAVLIDANTGRVLMEKNSGARLGMASTTKIMTAAVAIEKGNLDDIVTVSSKSAGIEGSSIYLKAGEKISLRDLLYGLMLNSGNDAGAAIAEHISGDTKSFADLMTSKAKDLGLLNTSFTNPHGLDDENHYTTAYDLAQITRYALEMPAFAEIVSTKVKTIYSTTNEGENVRTLSNHNKLLSQYKGADGVKTGFTKKCGRCLVSSATKDCLKLIAVTLSAPDDWNDHKQMMDSCFSLYKLKVPVKANGYARAVPLMGAETDKVFLHSLSDIMFAAKKDDKIKVVCNTPSFLTAPVYQGQSHGTVSVFLNGEEIKTVELVVSEDILAIAKRKIRNSYFYIIKELFNLFTRV